MPRFGKGRAGHQRAPYSVRQTTILPASLREELVAAGSLKAPKRQRGDDDEAASTSVIGRKQRRKDERSAKKAKPSTSSSKSNAKPAVKQVNSEQDKKAKQSKGVRFSSDVAPHDQKVGTSSPKKVDKDSAKSNKPTRLQLMLEQQESGSKSSKNVIALPKGPRSAVEKREDSEIAWYEAKLGIRKQGNGRKELEEDGLDGKYRLLADVL